MERYFSKRKHDDTPMQEYQCSVNARPSRVEINLDELPTDPAKRRNIYDLDANDREKIRRYYLQKESCQSIIDFPRRQFGDRKRRFVSSWFREHPSWLEYSVSEDSCYCLFCYLFKPERGNQSGGDVFVTQGFINWKEALKKFREHVGDLNSVHNKCMKACQDLMYEKQHIEVALSNQSEQTRLDYRTRLVASIDVTRLCLSQALAFRGHDESEESTNKGNLLIKLVMILPVVTTGIERSFSAMNIVKTRLCNRIGDEWLNDLLLTYIERDVCLIVKTEDVIKRFQNMKSRRGTL